MLQQRLHKRLKEPPTVASLANMTYSLKPGKTAPPRKITCCKLIMYISGKCLKVAGFAWVCVIARPSKPVEAGWAAVRSAELQAVGSARLVITFEQLDHIMTLDGLSITSASSGASAEVWCIMMMAHYYVTYIWAFLWNKKVTSNLVSVPAGSDGGLIV